jgi:uncharacterized protein (DUF58 family)
MPTRRGWTLFGACIGCVIAARAAGTKELYSVAVAAALLPLVASLTVRWSSYRLGLRRSISARRVFPHTPLRIELSVRNLGHLPTPPLLLEDEAPPAIGGPARFTLSSIGATRGETFVSERVPAERGRFLIGPLRARVVDPFGLAEAATALTGTEPVVVFPAIERLGGEGPPAERAGAGPAAVYRLAPGGDEFYGIREYESGDELRKIHWRSVARTGKLMIRQEEARFFPRATLFLDSRRIFHRGSGAGSSLEWGVSAVASVAWHLAREGFALRLATDEVSPTALRSGPAEPLLEALAVLKASGGSSVVPSLHLLARRPGADGALFAVLPPPALEELRVLARLRNSYAWCGAVLLDTDSFVETHPRLRAEADQRLAEAESLLTRTGWRVRTAGARERFREVWQSLAGAAPRPSSASPRS